MHCNAFERVSGLSHPGNRNAYAEERFDKDFLIASLAAEREIPKNDEPAWSVEISSAIISTESGIVEEQSSQNRTKPSNHTDAGSKRL